ncbi:putative IQ motif, EF-hand binding protein [Helianthus annuus]|nr:putative IQ motif, EF-hand binding protein [Helianthus annuus]
MGSGHWLKIIITCSKARKSKSNKTKGFSVPESYNLESQPQEKSKATVNDIARENMAAIRIQTAFRAFKARKVLRHLKGVSRLQTLTRGDFGKKQASNTLTNLQTWTKVQAQIRTRRKHMVENGGIRRKKLESQLKLETKLHDLEVEWSGGFDTKDEALARIQQREEAAVKRERAMAYAFTHQWRPNSKSNLGTKDSKLADAYWDWSWMDRWVVSQPWEKRVLGELTPKKVNSPANKAPKNSPKKTLRNRKLSYGSATKVEDANNKTETA